jgi:hypothetical protein
MRAAWSPGAGGDAVKAEDPSAIPARKTPPMIAPMSHSPAWRTKARLHGTKASGSGPPDRDATLSSGSLPGACDAGSLIGGCFREAGGSGAGDRAGRAACRLAPTAVAKMAAIAASQSAWRTQNQWPWWSKARGPENAEKIMANTKMLSTARRFSIR